MRKFYLPAILLLTLFCGSCKKDLLYFQNVQQIDSHTTADRLNQIYFVNDSVGFIVGGQRFYHSLVLRTKDGGYTWDTLSLPINNKGLYAITTAPNGAIYVTGFDGKLLHSYDMGNTWSFKQMEYIPFTGIAFTNAAQALLVGGVGFESGEMYYTDTSGNLIKRDSLAYQLNQIKMLNNSLGYTWGFGVVLKTTDGGNTWSFQNVKGDNFMAMDIHGDEMWMCGYEGSVYHTTDGGANWTRLRNGNDITLPSFRLEDIVFKDEMNGWAVGEDGLVIHSDDGGNHWMQYATFTHSTLRSIAICPNGDLLVAGDNGSLFRLNTQ